MRRRVRKRCPEEKCREERERDVYGYGAGETFKFNFWVAAGANAACSNPAVDNLHIS